MRRNVKAPSGAVAVITAARTLGPATKSMCRMATCSGITGRLARRENIAATSTFKSSTPGATISPYGETILTDAAGMASGPKLSSFAHDTRSNAIPQIRAMALNT